MRATPCSCCLSAGEVVKLTRIGKFNMSTEAVGVIGMLKRLRGSRKGGASSGQRQMKMLRQLPKLLRFIPGTAQDMRAYFLTLQYWLCGSEENLANLVRMLVDRYADGRASGARGIVAGRAAGRVSGCRTVSPARARGGSSRSWTSCRRRPPPGGTVGVLMMRSYVLSGNARHYDGVIAALEAKGLRVDPGLRRADWISGRRSRRISCATARRRSTRLFR